MFCSHIFLARKSPLATVWIAAHLQRKLSKSDVIKVDIPASVDCIMFPEVPIALRLSGHLLLGVVRIYSKKVNYAYHYSNEILANIGSAFALVQLNLPEEASRAQFHSITLPQTFELDALDLDDALYQAEVPDNHLKAHEDITMTDQIPGEGNPHVAFFISEDSRVDLHQIELPSVAAEPMDEDVVLSFPRQSGAAALLEPHPSWLADISNQKLEDQIPQNLLEIEILRDAMQPFRPENFQKWPDLGEDVVEGHEDFDPVTNQKNLSSVLESFSVSGGESVPSHSNPFLPTARSTDEPEIFELRGSLGPATSDVAMQPSPPLKKQEMNRMKRKQLFDESLVLTNEFIKRRLQDAGSLKRKRKSLPITDFDIWRSYKRLQMDQVFLVSSISGMCNVLQGVFKKAFLVSKADSVLTGALLEPMDAQLPPSTSAESPAGIPLVEIEASLPPRDVRSPATKSACKPGIEHPRFQEVQVNSGIPEFMNPTSEKEEFTRLAAGNLGSVSQMGKILESEALPTPEMPFAESNGLAGDSSLPEIPRMVNNTEAEALCFLEVDSTQAREEENEVGVLSARTRRLVQYLKAQPPTQISDSQSGHLSLNRILEGKPRKLCARMFFETLVLTSYGFIKVHQEALIGDISLSFTPMLSKAKV